eukprot:CAMPEP_0116879740 /NCGR_PEP_ID=MMETSP0463-20121206/11559_1 /TAXON_ID=181622 /ORGANISM="Strombidinopsis sp, Strain SopsisLIS2011" /LENGTH=105 /DNA_ID=CAMNT_0004529401 /DNA_START=652 /DNA_END=965 /DNA_ORIENTATION=+
MQRGYLPTEVLIKNNVYFENIWRKTGGEGIIADEFYDVILEIAAYAKKHLELSRELRDKLPKNSHRALILAIEAEEFLKDLEAANFDPFDDSLRKISYVQTPYKL